MTPTSQSLARLREAIDQAIRVDSVGVMLKVADLETALTLLTEARDALKPFVEPVGELDDIAVDLRCEDSLSIEDALFQHQQPTVGDLRKAAALYAKLAEMEEGS